MRASALTWFAWISPVVATWVAAPVALADVCQKDRKADAYFRTIKMKDARIAIEKCAIEKGGTGASITVCRAFGASATYKTYDLKLRRRIEEILAQGGVGSRPTDDDVERVRSTGAGVSFAFLFGVLSFNPDAIAAAGAADKSSRTDLGSPQGKEWIEHLENAAALQKLETSPARRGDCVDVVSIELYELALKRALALVDAKSKSDPSKVVEENPYGKTPEAQPAPATTGFGAYPGKTAR